MNNKKTIQFTVDLPALIKEASLLLAEVDRGGAATGVVFGFSIAFGHMHHLVKSLIANGDPEQLLRAFALGLVPNPVEHCKGIGTWDSKFNELAAELGAM